MKIIALQAENLKRLVAVEIRPNGHLVEITGKNGQGKTSVLDAIWWALEGATHIQAAPIRRGASEALIRLDLGALKVTRKFRAKEAGGFTTSITVENEEGARFPSPQAVLDALIGELSFDPLAFTRMKPADQFDTLRRFCPDVDFAAIDAANKRDFDERTAVNRRAKDLRAQAAGIATPPEPVAPADEAGLIAELERAGEHNAEIERRKSRREQAEREAGNLRALAQSVGDEIEDFKQRIAELERKRSAWNDQARELEDKLAAADALPAPIDTAALLAKIAEARNANTLAAAQKRRRDLEDAAAAEEAKATALAKALSDREAQKRAAIASAKMPIEGLSLGEGVVLLNDLPFDQASDAEQLRASIAIAAAMNPKLRVIRVRDGSLLDEDAFTLLGEFAKANDLQVWIERVDGSGRVGFVLEDGHVRAAAAPVTTSPQEVYQ